MSGSGGPASRESGPRAGSFGLRSSCRLRSWGKLYIAVAVDEVVETRSQRKAGYHREQVWQRTSAIKWVILGFCWEQSRWEVGRRRQQVVGSTLRREEMGSTMAVDVEDVMAKEIKEYNAKGRGEGKEGNADRELEAVVIGDLEGFEERARNVASH
ncbi:hypothetical protein B296_00014591 [Ensete ventricosum]|uniref:Uncharacterized protein n=1 Tax=Ensete ventricosum TaxID=4639 RepID=A0A426ZTX2_ENSVE|nr:hypothetical protein B296_00014591 [Ensete ventricosum]